MDDVTFFRQIPFLNNASISLGALRKIKFTYSPSAQSLSFSPLVFPTWNFRDCEFGRALFDSVPFNLPYQLPEYLDKDNEGALLRAYSNLYFTCVVALAKAFIDNVLEPIGLGEVVHIRQNDLDALLGATSAELFLSGVKEFMKVGSKHDYTVKAQPDANRRHSKPRYTDFGEIVDDLRLGYQKQLRDRKSRISVHYFLGYDRLARDFNDSAAFSEGLDYYCDFGVLVPETILDWRRGRIFRACRAGEPSSDYNWRRTQVLIPLAIDQFCAERGKGNSIDPTILNKLLSNFVYDYPGESHHELHSLIGEPYDFGTLVRAYHVHRASRKPSIYDSEKISPYYEWDGASKTFSVKKKRALMKEIGEVFDERQEVPFSEIVTYFRLLSRIYSHFKKVDILNLLSICREESYFYSHLVHNVRSMMEEISAYVSLSGAQEKMKALRDAKKHAGSASTKVGFVERVDDVMRTIDDRFGSSVEFINAIAKLKRNRKPFSNEAKRIIGQVDELVFMGGCVVHLGMFVETRDSNHLAFVLEPANQLRLKKSGVTFSVNTGLLEEAVDDCRKIVRELFQACRVRRDSLPREEPLLAARLRNESLERAKNIATAFVYRNQLRRVTLLYIDFTGLRQIPEPKEEVVSRYYDLVTKNCRRRSGEKLYGGSGGDDAFTLAFSDPAPAIQCAKDIKNDFFEDLFLRVPGRDVKFGLSLVELEVDEKEEDVVRCWGEAKDCCEFKGQSFRNRGNLLIVEGTLALLKAAGAPEAMRFTPLTGENVKGQQLYSLQDIQGDA